MYVKPESHNKQIQENQSKYEAVFQLKNINNNKTLFVSFTIQFDRNEQRPKSK